jgi:glycosyltransferase involved in cell wall biosynthesis
MTLILPVTIPKVSILIPAYNAEAWIAETIQSALDQTWPNCEIIIIDDGSTDRTMAIAQGFSHDRITVLTQPNQGAAAARNHALRLASGQYIQFLDADDLLAPNKIAQQVQLLQNSPSDCIASGAWARFYQHPREATFTLDALWQNLLPVDWLIMAWQANLMMHPAAWLMPRSVIEQAGWWNEELSLNDDGEYFCRVILASREVRFCGQAKSYYRSGIVGSLSDRKSDVAYRSAYRAIELCTQHLLQVESSSRTQAVCSMLFQRFIYETYPAVAVLQQKAEHQVQALGGWTLTPSGSPTFDKLNKHFGWRMAKKIQYLVYIIGYRRWKIQQKQKQRQSQTSGLQSWLES